VTHIGQEIGSDQQSKIDRFLTTGTDLADVEIPGPIEAVAKPQFFRKLLQEIGFLRQRKLYGVYFIK